MKKLALIDVADLTRPRADAVMHSFMKQNVVVNNKQCTFTGVTQFFDGIKTHLLKNDAVQTDLVAYILCGLSATDSA